jgi:hypothetical protein
VHQAGGRAGFSSISKSRECKRWRDTSGVVWAPIEKRRRPRLYWIDDGFICWIERAKVFVSLIFSSLEKHQNIFTLNKG